MKRIMKKKFAFALIFLFVVSASLIAYYLNQGTSQWALQNQNSQTSYVVKAIPVTYENIESILSANLIVSALPNDALMLLKFYNFNTGERQWEKIYILKRGYVSEIREGTYKDMNPDIILNLHSKYLKELTDQNLCSIVKKAKQNNDLGVEASLSVSALLWKYRGVLKYKECFGM